MLWGWDEEIVKYYDTVEDSDGDVKWFLCHHVV